MVCGGTDLKCVYEQEWWQSSSWCGNRMIRTVMTWWCVVVLTSSECTNNENDGSHHHGVVMMMITVINWCCVVLLASSVYTNNENNSYGNDPYEQRNEKLWLLIFAQILFSLSYVLCETFSQYLFPLVWLNLFSRRCCALQCRLERNVYSKWGKDSWNRFLLFSSSFRELVGPASQTKTMED